MDGLAFLDAVRERDANVPVVLFTRVEGEAVVERARERNVTYVQKFDGGYERLTSEVAASLSLGGA
jgi:DNA-binding NtrC family response regulator